LTRVTAVATHALGARSFTLSIPGETDPRKSPVEAWSIAAFSSIAAAARVPVELAAVERTGVRRLKITSRRVRARAFGRVRVRAERASITRCTRAAAAAAAAQSPIALKRTVYVSFATSEETVDAAQALSRMGVAPLLQLRLVRSCDGARALARTCCRNRRVRVGATQRLGRRRLGHADEPGGWQPDADVLAAAACRRGCCCRGAAGHDAAAVRVALCEVSRGSVTLQS
jgi:hypothetical protein